MGIELISADQIISCRDSLVEASYKTNTHVGAVTRIMVEELQERRRNGDYLWSSDTGEDVCLRDSYFHLASFLLHFNHNPRNVQRLIDRGVTLVSRKMHQIHHYGDGCASLEKVARETFVRNVLDYAESNSQLNKLSFEMERAAFESGIRLIRF